MSRHSTADWWVDISQGVQTRPWGSVPRSFCTSTAMYSFQLDAMLTVQDHGPCKDGRLGLGEVCSPIKHRDRACWNTVV